MRLLRFCFNVFAVCGSLFFLDSCVDFDTYKCDLYGYDDWRTELTLIISDFDPVFRNSNVVFESAEPYFGRIDSLSLLSDNNAFFPVSYKGSYNYMEIKSKSFIQDDTTTIHMPLFVVQNVVSRTLAKGDSVNWVKIEWTIDGEKKHSFAAFDKMTGEFIYDNVLFNMPWFFSTIAHNSHLTRSEGNGSGSSNGPNYTKKRQSVFRDQISLTYDNDTYKLNVEVICDVYYDSNGYIKSFGLAGATLNSSVTEPTHYHGYTGYHYDAILWGGSGLGCTLYCYLAVDDPSISGYYDLFGSSPVTNCQYAAATGSGTFYGGKYQGASVQLYNYLSQYLDRSQPSHFQNK